MFSTGGEGLILVIRLLVLGSLLFLVGLGGCRSWDFRGEGFAENDLSDFCSQYRKSDPGSGPAAFSTKARQIEQNLGMHP